MKGQNGPFTPETPATPPFSGIFQSRACLALGNFPRFGGLGTWFVKVPALHQNLGNQPSAVLM